MIKRRFQCKLLGEDYRMSSECEYTAADDVEMVEKIVATFNGWIEVVNRERPTMKILGLRVAQLGTTESNE